jgi:hypothetical protein
MHTLVHDDPGGEHGIQSTGYEGYGFTLLLHK